eukprot:gene6569-13292_t
MRAHSNGNIFIYSEGNNRGSTFMIELDGFSLSPSQLSSQSSPAVNNMMQPYSSPSSSSGSSSMHQFRKPSLMFTSSASNNMNISTISSSRRSSSVSPMDVSVHKSAHNKRSQQTQNNQQTHSISQQQQQQPSTGPIDVSQHSATADSASVISTSMRMGFRNTVCTTTTCTTDTPSRSSSVKMAMRHSLNFLSNHNNNNDNGNNNRTASTVGIEESQNAAYQWSLRSVEAMTHNNNNNNNITTYSNNERAWNMVIQHQQHRRSSGSNRSSPQSSVTSSRMSIKESVAMSLRDAFESQRQGQGQSTGQGQSREQLSSSFIVHNHNSSDNIVEILPEMDYNIIKLSDVNREATAFELTLIRKKLTL